MKLIEIADLVYVQTGAVTHVVGLPGNPEAPSIPAQRDKVQINFQGGTWVEIAMPEESTDFPTLKKLLQHVVGELNAKRSS